MQAVRFCNILLKTFYLDTFEVFGKLLRHLNPIPSWQKERGADQPLAPFMLTLYYRIFFFNYFFLLHTHVAGARVEWMLITGVCLSKSK